MKATKKEENTSLVSVIGTAVQIPGVKVNRNAFLCEQFKNESAEMMQLILEKGPIEAGVTRDTLKKKATKLVNDRTLLSSGTSFISGIPGGLAMAATIPADMLQFYGIALRLAQELIYLFGEADLWNEGTLDMEKVTNQLVLYCGVMMGATGAVEAVRLMTSALAKQALKKLPQKALTKTFYYPIVKSVAKAFGAKMTKNVFAKGVSKAVPLIGGVVSGGITLATMRPMGMRLAEALDKASFSYTQEDFASDWKEVIEIYENEEPEAGVEGESGQKNSAEEIMDKIAKAKSMLDGGIITESEFEKIKARLIAQM